MLPSPRPVENEHDREEACLLLSLLLLLLPAMDAEPRVIDYVFKRRHVSFLPDPKIYEKAAEENGN